MQMDNEKELPKRKRNRLENYDYSSCGAYFITVCTLERQNYFWENVGAIIDRPQDVELSTYGKMVDQAIQNIPSAYPALSLESYVIMPNHVHMIVVIGCTNELQKNPDLNQIIGAYKSGVSRKIHRSDPEIPVWQRSYHDHVIRGQADYEKIWCYIDTNPMGWEKDCFYEDCLW